MKNDPFFDVPRTVMTTSVGEVDLPALYYEVNNITFLFTAEFERVANKLRPFGLKPGLRWGKKAVVAVGFYEYQQTSIGPYNEVGLAIPALMEYELRPFSGWIDMYSSLNSRKTGLLIIDLPVTTEIAWAGGCELWGYPKFITKIPFQWNNNIFNGQVMDPENQNPIVTVRGKLGWGIPGPPMSLLLFSQLKDKMLSSKVNVRGAVKVCHRGSIRLQIGESDHVMAQNFRDLGLDNSQPLIIMSTKRFQSRLNLGEEITRPSD